MMTENAYPKSEAGILSGCISLCASLMSLGALSLYGKWHWALLRIRRAEAIPPSWVTWGVVDGMKRMSVFLAIVALIFAVVTLKRKRWLLGGIALILAIFCVWTIPWIT